MSFLKNCVCYGHSLLIWTKEKFGQFILILTTRGPVHKFFNGWGLASLAAIGVDWGWAIQEEEMGGVGQLARPIGADKSQAEWEEGLWAVF